MILTDCRSVKCSRPKSGDWKVLEQNSPFCSRKRISQSLFNWDESQKFPGTVHS